MNNWWSSYSPCNMMDPCSCGVFHTQPAYPNSFSMPFSSVDGSNQGYVCPYTSPPSSPSSSIDCTLSLGTPSTRLNIDNQSQSSSDQRHRPCSDRFSWADTLPSKSSAQKFSRGGATNYSSDDPLLARRCTNCDTNSTPLWRNGPKGPKSLCNACGIRFKKEEKRANAAATNRGGAGYAGMMVGFPTHY